MLQWGMFYEKCDMMSYQEGPQHPAIVRLVMELLSLALAIQESDRLLEYSSQNAESILSWREQQKEGDVEFYARPMAQVAAQ